MDDRHTGDMPVDPDLYESEAAERGFTENRPSPDATEPPGPRRRARVRPGILLAISAGAALGGPARYGVTRMIGVPENGFPWATLWINVSGSFALGFILVLILERFPPSRYLRPFFATGFLGAYTTFSTFAVEVDLLIRSGRPGTAAAYAGASMIAGVAAAGAGIILGRRAPVPAKDHGR